MSTGQRPPWGEWVFANLTLIALAIAAAFWIGLGFVALHFLIKHW